MQCYPTRPATRVYRRATSNRSPPARSPPLRRRRAHLRGACVRRPLGPARAAPYDRPASAWRRRGRVEARSPVTLAILDRIEGKGAGFRSLTEAIDTTTPAGRMMMQMVGSFAEFERAMIRECTSASLAQARTEGRIGGRRLVRPLKPGPSRSMGSTQFRRTKNGSQEAQAGRDRRDRSEAGGGRSRCCRDRDRALGTRSVRSG